MERGVRTMSQLGSKQAIKAFNRREKRLVKSRKQIRKKGKRVIKQTIALRKVKKSALKRRGERALITARVISPRHKADLIRPSQPFEFQRSSLESTAIKLFSYDPLTLTLEIQFWNVTVKNKVIISKRPGGRYLFFQVPESVHNNFIRASSKGRFFNDNIKGKYSFSKIG